MEAPRIQYAKSFDGVNIGYWTYGEGPPLIYLMHPLWGISHSLWQVPEGRAWYERLGLRHTLIRYDCRGTGESDRHADDYSLQAQVRDLEAVMDALQLERAAVMGATFNGPTAIAFAAQHPARASHLITWCTQADFRVHMESNRFQAFTSLRSMAEEEWDLYVNTMASSSFIGVPGDVTRRFADLMRKCVAPSQVGPLVEAQKTFVASEFLGQVQCPTLVVHVRDARIPSTPEDTRQLAAGIPGAELVMLEGDTAVLYLVDPETCARPIETFLGTTGGTTAPSRADIHTILFTDLASSTALTQRLGDANAQELVRAHNAIVREALAAHGGTEIKHTGDGIMASFSTASGALECAVAIQRAVKLRDEQDLQVHIGLNAGEPVAEESDLFGTSVQLARRICDHATSGQILVSNVVRELAAGKGYLFADIGEVVPKGFDDAVRLYEVPWRE